MIGGNSIENTLELQQPNFSVVIEDRVNDDESLPLTPPGLSTVSEAGELTGRSIEIGRRALDDQSRGRVSQHSFGTVRGSDQFDGLSVLGLNEVSQPLFDVNLLQNGPDAADGNLGSFAERQSFGLGFIERGWVRAMLIQPSSDLDDLRRPMYESGDSLEGQLNEVQQAPDLEAGVHSPFILNITELLSRHSSAEATYPDKQGLGCLNMESEQSVLHAKISNSNTTAKAGRRALKPLRKSQDGFPYPKFPPGIIRRIASTFARSLGSKSTMIDNETLEAITEAADQYFQQLSDDLRVFATHAKRKNINESDVVALMKR